MHPLVWLDPSFASKEATSGSHLLPSPMSRPFAVGLYRIELPDPKHLRTARGYVPPRSVICEGPGLIQ